MAKVAIVGHGWVGKAYGRMFENEQRVIYDEPDIKAAKLAIAEAEAEKRKGRKEVELLGLSQGVMKRWLTLRLSRFVGQVRAGLSLAPRDGRGRLPGLSLSCAGAEQTPAL